METLKEMKERHSLEFHEMQANCPHLEVKVYDRVVGFRHREITLMCESCGTPIVGWCGEGESGKVTFAHGYKRIKE